MGVPSISDSRFFGNRIIIDFDEPVSFGGTPAAGWDVTVDGFTPASLTGTVLAPTRMMLEYELLTTSVSTVNAAYDVSGTGTCVSVSTGERLPLWFLTGLVYGAVQGMTIGGKRHRALHAFLGNDRAADEVAAVLEAGTGTFSERTKRCLWQALGSRRSAKTLIDTLGDGDSIDMATVRSLAAALGDMEFAHEISTYIQPAS